MNKNRKIAIKNPQLRRIRDNLRNALIEAVRVYRTSIGEISLSIWWAEQLRKSICKCYTCGAFEKDVAYNAYLKRWYCVDCFAWHQREFIGNKSLRVKEGDWTEHDEKFFSSFL